MTSFAKVIRVEKCPGHSVGTHTGSSAKAPAPVWLSLALLLLLKQPPSHVNVRRLQFFGKWNL
jgi:hypothetical protein